MKSLPIIISIVLPLMVIAIGAWFFMSGSPPQPPSPPPTPPAAPPAEQPAQPPPLTFEQKINSLKQAIANVCATGESREITLTFTEAEANDQAAKLLATVEIPPDIPLEIERIHVDFQPGNNVAAEVKAAAYGFKPTIKVKAQVGIADGMPDVVITRVSFGFIPLPRLAKDKIVSLIGQEINNLQRQFTNGAMGYGGKVALEFTSINVQHEKATITLIVKPGA